MNRLIDTIRTVDITRANSIIHEHCGIVDFFLSEEEKNDFVSNHSFDINYLNEDRVAYGDWQTPEALAHRVLEKHISQYGVPDILIEPTCGLGAFVKAAIEKCTGISEIHAIEINSEYVNELKFKILTDSLELPRKTHPDIYIYNCDIFQFNISPIIDKAHSHGWNLGILGNPPWVTNSRQGKDLSTNIPLKQNLYGLKGIEAITGKSNFDISEYITLQLMKSAQNNNGGISFLLKNSVIRNLLTKQKIEGLHIGDIRQEVIDASAEFDVSVDASCMSARFGCDPSLVCEVKDFYTGHFIREYGWIKDSFVSDTDKYHQFAKYDTHSSYNWRSGIKHDCASVLELTLSDGMYKNGYGEVVNIEKDLIYPLMKSSDINHYHEESVRKFVIVPQRRIGEDTNSLKEYYPLAYSYLKSHEEDFSRRKSSIYRGKDPFSIFGVGDYSFSPYKIVVSSLYKDIRFLLISKYDGKPIIVDDTCYQLDFDNEDEAKAIYEALCSTEFQTLMQSLIFKDAKRVVTKTLLMRFDLIQICKDKSIQLNPHRREKYEERQLSLF